MLKLICDRYDWRTSRRVRGFLSQSAGHLFGGARPAPADSCAEAETPTTDAEPPRSALLDHAANGVAALVGCSGHPEASGRNRVASKRFPSILALAIPAAERSTSGQRRGSKSHSQDET